MGSNQRESVVIDLTDDRVKVAVQAFLNGAPVRVRTRTRDFTGIIFDLNRSVHEQELTVGVVAALGRVHYARVTKIDAKIELV